MAKGILGRKVGMTQIFSAQGDLIPVTVIEAEAKAERDKIEADAEAYAIKTKADAEAEANTKIAKSLIPELIDYIFAQNWNGELPTVSGGDFSNILDFRNLEEGF